MNRVCQSIENLIYYAEEKLGLLPEDKDYTRNSIIRFLGLPSYTESTVIYEGATLSKLLSDFTDACVDAGLFERDDAEYYRDGVMGELSLLPSEINRLFSMFDDTEKATAWLYDYCVANDYVKKEKLDANPRFEKDGLIITINKSKPEFRDPKKAASGNAVAGGYPKCSICHENEGFGGRSKRTLRTVDVELGGKKWFWQYSPYGYFYQHGILVNYEHTPMHIDDETFVNLMDFVDMFPHYFIGSNAALPRIGGSVLAHDHYQGGGEILPMHKAGAIYTLVNEKYPDVVIEIVDWQGSVFRIVSENRDAIVEICRAINKKWIKYENKELGIIPESALGRHSAVSPTVIKTDRGYEMSVILRNNVTTEKYPDGIFHAHPEFHIIKKESIGLIEAQGLFILPGRLEKELGDIAELIVNAQPLTDELSEFSMIYDEIIALCGGCYEKENVLRAIGNELASVCTRILENTAVFKDKMQLAEFVAEFGFHIV